MGVVNVTPDSFSDGGQFPNAEAAVAHGLRLLDEGADLLDIGGESTRPGVRTGADADVSPDQESARVLPVIAGLKQAKPDILISIDTYKAAVARQAVAAGATIVNDVSGLAWDPEMAHSIAEMKCGAILMHTRGTPRDWRDLPSEPRIVEVVQRELHERVQAAAAAGMHHDHIVLDPGFGFGKRAENNYPLLANFEELHSMGFPILVGLSRKSFLGKTGGARFGRDLEPTARVNVSLAAAVIAAMKGAHIVREHDVKPTVEALSIVDAVGSDGGHVNPWFDAYSCTSRDSDSIPLHLF